MKSEENLHTKSTGSAAVSPGSIFPDVFWFQNFVPQWAAPLNGVLILDTRIQLLEQQLNISH